MFYEKIKGNKELSNLLDEFSDFYFQNKDNSVLETLFKICDYFENTVQLQHLTPELKTLYCFILRIIGDYYVLVLDVQKGLRYYKEKIVKFKSQQYFDHDIFMAIYTKVGELYLHVDNKSKASECLSICVSYSIEKKVSSELIEYLNSLMLAHLDQKNKGIVNLINLFNNQHNDNSIFDYYFKNKIIDSLRKIIDSSDYEKILFPILSSRLKHLYNESLESIHNCKYHRALFMLKYALNYSQELQKNKIAVDLYPYIAYEISKLLFRFGFHKKSKELLEKIIQFI
ncbi:hypothetical protein KA977_14695, partial [Candidatus Dependentiae bacterium]|nr:hypothetical protein [Candidatus Dependentiae bacterium]